MSAAALSIWDVYEALNWIPHKAQATVLSNGARNRVVAAGRRFGKSEIGGHELVPECLITKTQASTLKEGNKRREFWIVGPEYTDSEKEFRILWNSLEKLQVPFDRPGSYNDPIGGSLHLSCWGGTFQVHGKSAKHPETLVGEGLHGVILAEAAKLKPRVWTKFVRPMLADFHGWSIMTSTPEGKNWFYDYWKVGQDPLREEWASWRFPAWRNNFVYKSRTNDRDVKLLQDTLDNPTNNMTPRQIIASKELLIDSEILALLEDVSTEAFNQEIGAEFTEFVGRVFKDFDEDVHVTDLEYNPQWTNVAASDWGFTNPSVWLFMQVGPYGQVHVLDEIYRSGLTVPEFGKEILDRGLGNITTFYPDPASPGDTRQLEQILQVQSSGGTGGEIKDRIEAIRRALKDSPLEPRGGRYEPQLRFSRRCPMTVQDMLNYRYPEHRDSANPSENPMKKDDHGPEALGRFFKGHFGTSGQLATRRVHRRANISR